MTTDTREGLPDWLTVGATVVQVHDRRHYGQTVITGTVHRILARDVVVLNSEGAELTRFRRTDYVLRNDYFRRSSSSYAYADWVYLYRADDPRAVAARAKANMQIDIRRLKEAVDKIDTDSGAEAFAEIAAAAAKLAGQVRERR